LSNVLFISNSSYKLHQDIESYFISHAPFCSFVIPIPFGLVQSRLSTEFEMTNRPLYFHCALCAALPPQLYFDETLTDLTPFGLSPHKKTKSHRCVFKVAYQVW